MRLIDADAFVDFLKDTVKRQKYEDTKIDGLLTVADVIEAIISELEGTSLDGFKNAPTIEPERKAGEWIPVEDRETPYGLLMECSKCKNRIIINDALEHNYCSECGADMRGGQDDKQ